MRITADIGNAFAQSISDIFSDGLLELYDGIPGPDPATISVGCNLLCEILLPAVAFTPPVDGVLSRAGEWFGTVMRPGVVSWARMRDRAGDSAMIVTVSNSSGLAELRIDNLTLEEGAVVSIQSFAYQAPLS